MASRLVWNRLRNALLSSSPVLTRPHAALPSQFSVYARSLLEFHTTRKVSLAFFIPSKCEPRRRTDVKLAAVHGLTCVCSYSSDGQSQNSPLVTDRASLSAPEGDTNDFSVIYKFPYIVHMRVVSRFKIVQTGITSVVLLPMAALTAMGHVEPWLLTYTFGVTGLAAGMLCVMSYFFRRLIGILALSNDGDMLKVSHMTFWGRRHDIYVPVDSVVPFSDCESNPTDIFVNFMCDEITSHLYISLRFGGIVDREKFMQVFGREIPPLK
ncbi:PREDICTED: transmembrane protein 186-like [Priapulus caudatus]|uniref:Transmembrane protein 186 n=1 Tax=Priapulus caudatus TaxID=37621 RepID=A0ABM1ELG4_PRICU|nr:PREDICTED: transmembrane protein 186-like [Priapulus caudatus]